MPAPDGGCLFGSEGVRGCSAKPHFSELLLSSALSIVHDAEHFIQTNFIGFDLG